MDNQELVSASHNLPANYQFYLLLCILIITGIITILKQISDRKLLTKLSINEEQITTLIALLYANFSNVVTIDVAEKIIDLIYTRTRYRIIERTLELITTNYSNGSINFNSFKDELIDFINNKYYEDSTFLNKITCKDTPIGIYHIERLQPTTMSGNILAFIENLDKCDRSVVARDVNAFISNYFTSISNKSIILLTNNIKNK